MYSIDENLKNIYKNDMFPNAENAAPKDIELSFPSLSLTIGSDQFATDKGDFELHESICMDEQLKFGKCNASSVKFTLADVADDIKGKEFSITQTVIDGETSYPMPLGYFTVDTAKKEDDLRFKDIVSYDRMKKIDVDVSEWYNSLFPNGNETYTLAQFRASFLAFVGLTEDTSRLPLPNDSMTVPKTIDPSQLSGRTVIEACEELNGTFGLMGRDGKFTHVILKPMFHDYPQNDYPQNDYPELEPYDEYLNDYQGMHFEEYRVQPIDKLQIRQEENDVGCIYGTGTNVYIIQGNFLVYGKSAEELQTIAQNASVNIFDRGYRPYSATGNGLPYIMPGDFIKYNADDTTAGYIFERTLTGLQALQDEYSAKGSEKQEQSFDTNNQIVQMKGRMAKITKTVDEVAVSVTDLDKQLTADINVLAGQVILKTDASGRLALVELGSDASEGSHVKIVADDISLEGLVTINGNFKVLADGSIEAVNGKFSGEINASSFTGGSININNNFTVDETGKVTATNAEITGKVISYSDPNPELADKVVIDGAKIQGLSPNGMPFYILQSTGCTFSNMYCDSLNNGTPITTANYNSLGLTYPASDPGGATGTFTADGITIYVTNGRIVHF